MSVDALVEAIEAEAVSEAERLLADAEATVAARVADAEAAARSRVAATLADAASAIRGAEIRALNAARLALAARRTARLAARSEAVFVLAERRLAGIVDGGAEPGRWTAAVRRLAAETVDLTGTGEIRVRPDDALHLGDLLPGFELAGITLVTDTATPPGIRGRSADGRLAVDATVAVRMARARSALLPDVAAALRDPVPDGVAR